MRPFGDREQRIALVGRNLDRTQLTLALDGCLLNPAEVRAGAAAWEKLPDPLRALDETSQTGLLAALGPGPACLLH